MASALADDRRFGAILSLAGATKSPRQAAVTTRVGGFGGPAGLSAYLVREKIDALIDATHPFAAQISANAVQAATVCNLPFLAVRRPQWTPVEGDRWTAVPSLDAAAAAIGATPQTVFLTTGRKDLGPFRAASQHTYVIRSVDPPDPDTLPAQALVITDRGPFDEAGETALMREHGVEVIVSKNSGGVATAAKLAAARRLNLPIIMVERPPSETTAVPDAETALRWLVAHHTETAALRGV